MVSKAAIGIGLVVFLLMAGISVFLGLQLVGGGGPGDAQTTAQSGDDGGSNGGGGGGGNGGTTTTNTTTNATNGTATPTPRTVTANATTEQPNATATPVPASSFNETLIEQEALRDVNEKRTNRGLDELTISGNTFETMTEMSRNHSDNMAAVQDITHKPYDDGMVARYKKYDLYGTCRWDAADANYFRRPRGNNFEAIGKVVAGREYSQLGQTRYNRNESQVAQAIADFWFKLDTYKERLSYPNANRLSVGVNVTETGDVYATANVC